MTEMNAYWASMAQLVAILLLAFVVEVRALMRTWTRVPRWLRVIQGITYLVYLVGAVFVLVTAVRGSRPGSDDRSSLAGIAEATVTGLLVVLLTIPFLNIVGRAFAEPLARILICEPWMSVKLWALGAFRRILGWFMPRAAAKDRRRNERQRLEAVSNRDSARERLDRLGARLASPDLAGADRERVSASAVELADYITRMDQYIEACDRRAAETDQLERDADVLVKEINDDLASVERTLATARRLVAARLVSTEDFTEDIARAPTTSTRRGWGRSPARRPHRNAQLNAARSRR